MRWAALERESMLNQHADRGTALLRAPVPRPVDATVRIGTMQV
jgi:hypothetical protein